MTMRAIKLVGCGTYHYFPKKKNYTKGKVSLVSDGEADKLLSVENDQGMPYFVEVALPSDAEAAAVPAKAKKKAPARKKAKPAPEPVQEEPDEDPSTEDEIQM